MNRELRDRLGGVDLRALAAFRIGLGVVVLADLLQRLGELRAHYSDFGMLPLPFARAMVGDDGFLSLHLLAASTAWQAFLMTLLALAAAAYAVGFRARVANALCFWLLLSLHLRNPLILHGGDNLLRYLLFWSLFLPVGRRWSFDARGGENTGPGRVVSVGSFTVMFLLCFIYWLTVAWKWNAVWLETFEAVGVALSVEAMTTSWGQVLKEIPGISTVLTPAVLVFEIVGPALVWLPWATDRIRGLTALAFILFHLVALAPAIMLGIFPWVAGCAWLLFLPPSVWDRVEERLGLPAVADQPDPVRASRAGNAVVAVSFLLVAWHAIAGVPAVGGKLGPPRALSAVLRPVGMHQQWYMYADPPRADGWYVVLGKLRDGSVVDVWQQGPPRMEKPEVPSETYGSLRWFKYLEKLQSPEYAPHTFLFGKFLCRRWNEDHAGGQRVEAVEIHFVLEYTEAIGRELDPRPVLLAAFPCDAPDGTQPSG